MSTYEDDLRRYKRLYEEEYQIVAKCWEALGISTYEGANGRSIYELIAECRAKADRSGEADQRDAARYRWLRDTDTAVVAWLDEDGPHWSITGRNGHNITRDKLDAAIDAAMSARNDTEESK